MNNPITEEQLTQWFDDANNGQRDPMQSDRGRMFRLIENVRALKAENEELTANVQELSRRLTSAGRELGRTRNVCVALESHIADSSLARFRHENVDRFVPEPGYPNGTDSEIEVASPLEIHPEGVPTR